MSDQGVSVYLPPSMRRFKPERVPQGPWTAHVPLAYDLAEALRPRLLLGLGVGWGAAYYGYCQSVLEHDLDTLCCAAGLWEQGEGGYSGDELHEDVCIHGRELYSGFAYVLRMPFAQALMHFSDDSIDLIHLDEHCPVSELPAEIERWYSKLRPGGVLVVHDVGRPGSELRMFWDQYSGKGDAFIFDGEPAIALMRKPGTRLNDEAALLRILFGGEQQDGDALRALYARAARYLDLDHRIGSWQIGRMSRKKPGND